MINLKFIKTMGVASIMALLVIGGIFGYWIGRSNPPVPDDIAHDAARSYAQAEAQSPAVSQTEQSPGYGMSNGEILSTCDTFRGATWATINARNLFRSKDEILGILKSRDDMTEDTKGLVLAMTLDVYENPNGLSDKALAENAFKHCLTHYGYSR